MFLIKEIGERIELDNEPILLGNFNDYVNPLNRVRKDIVDRALSSLPPRYTVNEEMMADSMLNARYSFSLTDAESVYMVYKWLSQNIEYDCLITIVSIIQNKEHIIKEKVFVLDILKFLELCVIV